MKIYGGIYFDESGISTSIRGMHLQTEMMGVMNDNINGFNKVGYQKQTPVLSSFAEFIGPHALSSAKNEEVGRLTLTKNPLDFAMGKVGYFQYKTPDGIKLTRDGRFKLDKEGFLTNLEGHKVLGADGLPVKFKKIPEKLEDIKVGVDGVIKVYDKETNKIASVGALSVVSTNGNIAEAVDVRQGFVEDSNVSLQEEFLNLVPVRRSFEANRQMYIIQNDALTKILQELGRA